MKLGSSAYYITYPSVERNNYSLSTFYVSVMKNVLSINIQNPDYFPQKKKFFRIERFYDRKTIPTLE